jgi:hypothetical protein
MGKPERQPVPSLAKGQEGLTRSRIGQVQTGTVGANVGERDDSSGFETA